MTPKRIGLIGFPGVTSIDLSGPAEAFARAEIDRNGSDAIAGYEIITVAESARPFAASCGLIFKPNTTFNKAPAFDTIIIPGGRALQHPTISAPIAAFIRRRANATRRVISLSTGIYGLTATGLLAERRVTTHWRCAQDVARRFPAVRVEEDALFVKDGKFYTCAGATAAIDLALSLIEEDYGHRVSLAVARDLVVHLKRSGDQEQYSEALQFQTTSISRLSDLTTWIISHLDHDLSVENLATRACLCPRQFGRRFKTEVGTTPAEFVEKARVEEARRRLCTSEATIESVAASVGYTSSDVFRRRFESRVGMSPTEFRRRFNKSTSVPTKRQSTKSHQAAA